MKSDRLVKVTLLVLGAAALQLAGCVEDEETQTAKWQATNNVGWSFPTRGTDVGGAPGLCLENPVNSFDVSQSDLKETTEVMAAQVSVWRGDSSEWPGLPANEDVDAIVLTTMRLDVLDAAPPRLPAPALMQEMYIPMADLDETPVAVEVTPSEVFPLGAAATEQPAVGILHASGETSWYEGVTTDWPVTLEYVATLPAPVLPSGITDRYYCDIEVLADGDIILTFAQTAVTPPLGDLDEGYIRFDSATQAWGQPRTAVLFANATLTYYFKHTEKAGEFSQNSCLSVDGLVASDRLMFASNSGLVLEAPGAPLVAFGDRVIFDVKASSGIPSMARTTKVPSLVTGDGYIEGLAAITPDIVVIARDRTPFLSATPPLSGDDGAELLDLALNPGSASFLAGTYGDGFEAAGLAATRVPHQYESACDSIAAFVTVETYSNPNGYGECAEFGVLKFEFCDV